MTMPGSPARPGPALVREERLGDPGWIIERQALLYAEEFRYSALFQTYLAEGVAAYLRAKNPALDRLWIAELEGERVGSIAVQHDPERPHWAKLRWYFVERHARGTGLGSRLMERALEFARGAGYRKIFLWTVNDLHAARAVYERAGFQLVHEDAAPCPWAPWGHEQRWELGFTPSPAPAPR